MILNFIKAQLIVIPATGPFLFYTLLFPYQTKLYSSPRLHKGLAIAGNGDCDKINIQNMITLESETQEGFGSLSRLTTWEI